MRSFLLLLLLPLLLSSPSLKTPLPSPIVSQNESTRLHLSDYLDGYNLSYSLNASDPFAKYLSLSQSLNLLKTGSSSDKPAPFSKYQIEKNLDNSWSGNFYTLQANPSLNSSIILINSIASTGEVVLQKNLSLPYFCYDVVRIQGYLIVDCRDLSNAQNDIFMLLDLTNPDTQRTIINNTLAVNLENRISRNLLVQQSSTSLYYLLRTPIGLDNGFIDIFVFWNNTLQIGFLPIDRFSLGLDSLRVDDWVGYGHEVFLLNGGKQVVRFGWSVEDRVEVKKVDVGQGGMPVSKIKVFNSPLEGLRLLAVSLESAFVFDWSEPTNAFMIEKYESTLSSLKNIDFCESFILIHGKLTITAGVNSPSSYNSYILKVLFRRSYLEGSTFAALPSSPSAIFTYNPSSDRVLLIDGSSFSIFSIDKPFLLISASNAKPGWSEFILNVTSVREDLVESQTFGLKVQIIEEKNQGVLVKNLTQDDLGVFSTFPNEFQLDLNNYFSGPNLTYTVSFQQSNPSIISTSTPQPESPPKSFLNPNTNPRTSNTTSNDVFEPVWAIKKINQTDINITGFNPADLKNLLFSKLVVHPLNSSNSVWFVQLANGSLFLLEGSQMVFEKKEERSIDLLGKKIKRIEVVKNEGDVWFGLQLETLDWSVYFYEFQKLNLIKTVQLNNSLVQESIADFTVVNFHIYLVLANQKIIRVVNLAKNDFSSSFVNIDGKLVPQAFFTPRKILTIDSIPNVVFVVSDGAVHIINVAFVVFNYLHYYGAINDDLFPSANILLSSRSLIAISSSVIREFSISDFTNIYKRKDYNIYGFSIEGAIASAGSLFSTFGKKDGKREALIFDSGRPSNEALYGGIPIEGEGVNLAFIDDSPSQILLTGDFGARSFLIYPSPILVVDSFFANLTSPNQTIVTSFNITAQNIYSKSLLTFTLTNWNTYINFSVTLNETLLDTSSFLKVPSGNSSFTFSPSLLINGSVTSYNISFENQEDASYSTFKAPLTKVNLLYTKFILFTHLDKKSDQPYRLPRPFHCSLLPTTATQKPSLPIGQTKLQYRYLG